MIAFSSRHVKDLDPKVQPIFNKFLDQVAAAGFTIVVTCTLRNNEAQDDLYDIGRVVSGNPCHCGGVVRPIGKCPTHPRGLRVTNARGGESYHNYGLAIDIVPLRHGKPVWGTHGDGIDNNPLDDDSDDMELWQRIAQIGKSCGLEWAGDWKSMREYPHFQYTFGLTISDLKAGKRP